MPSFDTFHDSNGKFLNFYKLLEIEQHATAVEVTKAYRSMAKKVHPDRVRTGSKQDAEENFKLLNRANEVLRDDVMRRTYDGLYALYVPRSYRKPTRPRYKASASWTEKAERDKWVNFPSEQCNSTEYGWWTGNVRHDNNNMYNAWKSFERRSQRYASTTSHTTAPSREEPGYSPRSSKKAPDTESNKAEAEIPKRKPQPYSWSARKESCDDPRLSGSESSSQIDEVDEEEIRSSTSEREFKFNQDQQKGTESQKTDPSPREDDISSREGSISAKRNNVPKESSRFLASEKDFCRESVSHNDKDVHTTPPKSHSGPEPEPENSKPTKMPENESEKKPSEKWKNPFAFSEMGKNPFAFSEMESTIPRPNSKSGTRDADWYNPFDKKPNGDSKELPIPPTTNANPFSVESNQNPFAKPNNWKWNNPFVLPNPFAETKVTNPFLVTRNPFAAQPRVSRVRRRSRAGKR